jgi:hypothetical protein
MALVVRLWLAVCRRGGRVSTPARLLGVITGVSWLADRVDSSRVGVGLVGAPARAQ